MAMYSIKESTLKNLANAIRSVNGETRTYTATEMIDAETTIMDSVVYLLVDEDGHEVPAVYVDSETVFTAEHNDIREGKVAANEDGVVVGTKEIPNYYVYAGYKLVAKGSKFIFDTANYDYKKLQAIICPFKSNLNASVIAEKVAIDDDVYNVLSNESVSQITKDSEKSRIDFGLVNDTDSIYVIRYFMYTEVY